MKQLFLAIQAQLKTVIDVQYIHIWNNQIENLREGKEYAFRFKAIFIEFVIDQVGGVGNNVQLFDPLRIRIHVCMDQLDAGDGTLEQNLDIFDFKQAVYKKMQLFQCNGSSPFDRQGPEEPDYNHDNMYHYIQDYMTTYVDQDLPLPIDGIEADPPFITEITPVVVKFPLV